MPGQRWTHELLSGGRPQVRVNNWLVLLEAVRTGAGLAILPCYLGGNESVLHRIGTPLDEVAIDQWLLVHRDLRNLPRVRAVMDAVIRLFHEERAVLEGRRSDAKKRAVA
jgi:DNA-binding transcriptional LysR family regulator